MVPEGTEGVKVNTPIAVLLAEGEDASAIEEASSDGSSHAAPHEGSEQTEPAKGYGRNPHAGADHGEEPSPTPAAGQAAAPASEPASKPEAGRANGADGKRIFASPLARRIAAERGLDLAQIKGSGPHGRIVKADVESAEPRRGARRG